MNFNLNDVKRPKSLLERAKEMQKLPNLVQKSPGEAYPSEVLTPRQLGALKAQETKRMKHEKRVLAAQRAAITRKNNELKKKVQAGKHSANEVFNKMIQDMSAKSRNMTR